MNEKIQVGQLGSDQWVAIDFILLDSELIGADEKILYAMLKRYKNRNSKYCYPSLLTLESKLNWSRKTLLKKIDNLVDAGLVKKISSKSPKENNRYILFPPNVVLGGKQLNLTDLTEDEQDMLSDIDHNLLIEANGKVLICASEKLAFYLKAIYKRIDFYAETIKEQSSYAETSVIIEELKRFYEGIASCPYVVLEKRITDDCERIESEKYLEKVKDFDFQSIVEIVREVNENGLPVRYADMPKNSYILSYLWKKRDIILSNSFVNKIEQANRNLKIAEN